MRPVLPSAERPFVARVRPLYSDGDTLCASLEITAQITAQITAEMAEIDETAEGEAPGVPALRLLLSRDEAEYDVAKRRRG